ncbi:ARF GTPase-activating protein GIT2b isoform X2 [Triplophysa rosa]|uniref:G protein-coupled receptor kinase interacting ArfGAP 2 n=1 Tax=Triplophysa rosa TaxID=992332 RepID=A0A9W7WD98_TRIRA|nr:ARF GTPase-activating protein GIT2b isoform X2 [Triplophysa rosa]KAI7793638.1 G protein-coupled receptor kinase interacting ArfGAP 2 [Triplophysa rosa]
MSMKARNREICADCSASDPRWASINRGVLICDECCSIHRGLGRHSSQVRHLTHAAWPLSQLQMVKSLYSNGANSIWEHSLLDPSSIMSGKRKANPQDRIHPNKTEFIKAKYQMLAFVHRMPCREDDSITAKDLSKQLHSSVRTGNLETCLRLLSLGAQANFFHPEKGNTPLHVAAKAGQLLQAELLTVYGADPGSPDSSGKTAIDYARQAGHQELADRLLEIQFELTDRLAFYLCGRKPDHKTGQHFIIPQIADSSLDLSELAKAAKKKLQSLSNHQFEELAMDVYDEVDRRETDGVWLATQNHSTFVTDTTIVPFLPVNPEYSSTRNQGRQKLARFNAHEFATLVIDILADAKRRQQGSSPDNVKDNVELILKDIGNRHGSVSPEIDQPDYDSVASDEENDQEPTSGKDERTKSSESSDLSDSPITVQEFMEVKNALHSSEAKIQQLLKVNCHLSDELRIMQSKLNSLQNENSTLKWQTPDSLARPQDLPHRAAQRGCRAMSMYETSSVLRQYPPRGETAHRDTTLTLQPLLSNIGKGPSVTTFSSLPSFPSPLSWSRDERTQRGCSLDAPSRLSERDDTLNQVENEDSCWVADDTVPSSESASEGECDPTLPCTEAVISKTELITKNIQELLRAAQENKHESFVPCSDRILDAVTEMATLFPKRPSSETIRGSLRLLTSSASRLQCECQKASPHDSQQVIQCAYDIAKAAKQLVTVTTKDSN